MALHGLLSGLMTLIVLSGSWDITPWNIFLMEFPEISNYRIYLFLCLNSLYPENENKKMLLK